MKIENEIKQIKTMDSKTINNYRSAYKSFIKLRDLGLTKQTEKEECLILSNIKEF